MYARDQRASPSYMYLHVLCIYERVRRTAWKSKSEAPYICVPCTTEASFRLNFELFAALAVYISKLDCLPIYIRYTQANRACILSNILREHYVYYKFI